MQLLSPLWDYVFKHIFAGRGNTDVLSAFLKATLGLPDPEFDRLTIVDPFLQKLSKKDKSGILDIKVHTTSGKIIDVEVQVEAYSGMRNRILYYRSKLIWEQLKAGDDYESLNQVIVIAVCDHVLLPEEAACINSYHLRNDLTGCLFTETEHILILELPKLAGEAKNKVELWMRFFKGGSLEEMEMLGKQDKALGKAVAILKELSLSKRHRLRAEAREKWRKDVNSWKKDAYNQGHTEGLAEGLTEGRAEGLNEGLTRGRLESAKKMKELGDSAEKIALVTGFSEEDIRKL
jgi:predicted transposase/invertase (TIGR01784 family)